MSVEEARRVEIDLSKYVGEISRLYYHDRKSYAEIGVLLGKKLRKEKEPFSREAIRQVLNSNMPDRVTGHIFRAQQNEERRRERDLEELIKRMKEAVPCAVCGCWVLRRTGYRQRKDGQEVRRTCSTGCSKKWTTIRYKEDKSARERQRQSMARSILKKPDARSPSEVSWAERVLQEAAT